MPNEPGKALTFKALQTYTGGEVVRWIGPPDADEPAPQVTLAAAEEEEAAGSHATEAEVEPPPLPRVQPLTTTTRMTVRRLAS